ncbi:MAG: hypothetical protein MPW15_22385 [Candidatus Manganitrophus sp.]|nr:hypothetical protein [Candidatus Manganitrophus sp.]
MILLLAGCDATVRPEGRAGVAAVEFVLLRTASGGGSTGGGGSQNPNLSVSAVPGDGQNTLTFALTSGNADSFNIYWSTSPDTTAPTWTKIEGVTSPFLHDRI